MRGFQSALSNRDISSFILLMKQQKIMQMMSAGYVWTVE